MRTDVHEIRIHGVSGTPAWSMLKEGSTADVVEPARDPAPDGRTGFYTLTEPDPNATHQIEAYSWGGLTSGVPKILQAEWTKKTVGWAYQLGRLLILPFALANVAYWARPEIDRTTKTRDVTAILARVAGLLLTMAFVATACVIGIDLIAWQCFRGGSRVCFSATNTLPFLPMALPDVVGWLEFFEQRNPARRVLLGSLLPLLALLALGVVSRRSARRLEDTPDIPAGLSGKEDSGQESRDKADRQPVLRRRRMWQGQVRLRRQRQLHAAAGIGVIVAFGSYALDHARLWFLFWPAIAVVTVAVVAVVFSWRDGNEFPRVLADESGLLGTSVRWLSVGTFWGSVVLLIGYGATLWPPRDWSQIPEARDMLGQEGVGLWFFLPVVAIVTILAWTSRGKAGAVASVAGVASLALTVMLGRRLGEEASTLPGGHVTLEPASVVGATAVIALLVAVPVSVHSFHRRSGQAWGGAAPAVALGGAVVVAILYSAAAVAGAAWLLGAQLNQLPNGFDDEASNMGLVLDAYEFGWDQSELRAVGDVVVRDAVASLDGDQLTVWQGTITMHALLRTARSAAPESGRQQAVPYSVTLPDVDLSDVPVAVADPGDLATIAMVNTCLTDTGKAHLTQLGDAVCTDEQGADAGRYLREGTLEVGDTVQIGAPGSGTPDEPSAVVRATVDQSPQEALVLPNVLAWTGALLPIWLAVIVLEAVARWFVYRRTDRDGAVLSRRTGTTGRVVHQREDDERRLRREAGSDDPRVDRSCDGPRLLAAWTHRGELLLRTSAVATIAWLLCIAVGTATGQPPWAAADVLRGLTGVGVTLFAMGAVGLGLLAGQLVSSHERRRQVGIIWDLTSFWPRTAHPFAPPCYPERVVPEITGRVKQILDGDSQARVILSGHSQGSAIAVAVASRLSDAQLERVYLVTYGSQLRVWYSRFCPGVLGPGPLSIPELPDAWDVPPPTDGDTPGSGLRARLDEAHRDEQATDDHHRPTWVNLFRRTDPIGFPVFSSVDFDDGTGADRWVPERRGGQIETHAAYQFTPEYRDTIRHWLLSTTHR